MIGIASSPVESYTVSRVQFLAGRQAAGTARSAAASSAKPAWTACRPSRGAASHVQLADVSTFANAPFASRNQTRRASQSAIARLAVSPGDSIPNRLISPAIPWSLSVCRRKSVVEPPGRAIFGRMPA